MTRDEAVQHFGTQEQLARALGIRQASVSLWGERPPPMRQLQIEALTSGRLRADESCDKFKVGEMLPQVASEVVRDAA